MTLIDGKTARKYLKRRQNDGHRVSESVLGLSGFFALALGRCLYFEWFDRAYYHLEGKLKLGN